MNQGSRLPSTPEPSHYWIGHRGVRIAGDSWGDSRNQLVLLLHGGGQTRHAWNRTGRTLAASGYFAVALDSRGHGDSEWAEDGLYSQDAKVEDVVAVLDLLNQPRPILVGASMGGLTSLVAVGEGRVNARALVLVDISPRIEPEGVKKIHEFMAQNPDGFDSLEEVSEAISNYQPHRKRTRRLDGLAKNVRLGDDGKFHWHWDPKSRNRETNFEEREIRMSRCAANLTLPTLLIRGGLSDVLTEEGARVFLGLCPHAEYVNIEGAAHMVAGDRNDVFSNSVIEFLTREVPPSPSD